MIVQRSVNLAFEIEISSIDVNATIYQNLGRVIIKKTTIRISGNGVMSIDNSDVYDCYVDLWKGPSEQFAMAYQSIDKDNMLKHRIGVADAATNEEDKSITTAF